jgi:hypothetical protein
VGIYSTAIGGTYRFADGTSFAAPIVAGVAALAWSINPDLRPATIRDLLLQTAKDAGPTGKDATYGHGVVDALAAVQRASQTPFVADELPPTARLEQPTDGLRVSGAFLVTATAKDDMGVADVTLSIDDAVFTADARAPYTFLVDSASFSPGRHELAVTAVDLSGNLSETSSIAVMFGGGASPGASGIVFRAPASGSIVSGDVRIEATVSDVDGLAVVEWLIDGAPIHAAAASGTSSGVSYVWRAGAAAGPHTITITVTDLLGNQRSGSLALMRR